MDSYLQSCCGDQLQWRLPDSLEASIVALCVTLAAGMVTILLLRRLRPAPPPPDQCGGSKEVFITISTTISHKQTNSNEFSTSNY